MGSPQEVTWELKVFYPIVALHKYVVNISYGKLLNDNLLSILLSLFGLGFAFTAIPIDMQLSRTPVSKAHIVAICLALAFWSLGLAKLGSNRQLKKKIRNRANFTGVILVLPIIGFALGIWSMPITHRLVFGIVFGWTALTSIELVFKK